MYDCFAFGFAHARMIYENMEAPEFCQTCGSIDTLPSGICPHCGKKNKEETFHEKLENDH